MVNASSATTPMNPASYSRMDDIRLNDISISTLDGSSLSLINHYAVFELTEDIFQNCVHGVVSCIDASNLITNFPITGQELLTISFNTPSIDREVELIFLIDKISQRHSLNNKQSQVYDIHFVSPTFMINMVNSVSKAYTNKSISDIVEDIHHTYILRDSNKTYSTLDDLYNEGQLLNIDYTDGTTNIIIPHWNPFTAINWLSKRATSSDNPRISDYVYYQDMDGFHFRSIREMFKSGAKEVYLYGIDNANDMIRDHISKPVNIDQSKSNIRNMLIGAFDRSKEVHRGTYASSVLLHDIVNKSYNLTQYNYLDDFENNPSLNGNPYLSTRNIYANKPESKTFFVPTQMNMYGEPSGVKTNSGNDGVEEWLVRHDAQIEQLKSSSMIIEVSGDSTRRIGDVVHILVNSFQGEDENGQVNVDNILSGNYLVTSIKHVVSKNKGHTMKLKLCKESTQEKMPEMSEIEQPGASPTNFNSIFGGKWI